MANEEFQRIVLDKINNLEEGQAKLGQGQEELKKSLKVVIEQTANLTEFREEANDKLDTLLDNNWNR